MKWSATLAHPETGTSEGERPWSLVGKELKRKDNSVSISEYYDLHYLT